jgi:hypothetical protein
MSYITLHDQKIMSPLQIDHRNKYREFCLIFLLLALLDMPEKDLDLFSNLCALIIFTTCESIIITSSKTFFTHESHVIQLLKQPTVLLMKDCPCKNHDIFYNRILSRHVYLDHEKTGGEKSRDTFPCTVSLIFRLGRSDDKHRVSTIFCHNISWQLL